MSSILISYIKNNEEKQVNLLNYEKEKKNLFVPNYEIDLNKFSSLINKKTIKEIGFKEDVEYVHIKNVTFNGTHVFNNDNNNIIIILEDCIFNCDELNLERGTYQIINPHFKSKTKNNIKIYNCKDVEIIGNIDNQKTNINIIEAKLTNNLSLISINEIKKLKINTDNNNLILDNINNINKYDIHSDYIEIKNCSFNFSNLFHNTLDGEKLSIKNTKISTNKLSLLSKNIELVNSTIKVENESREEDKYDYMIFQSFKFPNLESITLTSSSIITPRSIIFPNLKNIKLDDKSFLQVSGRIKIGEYNYKNEINIEKNFILNKDILQSKFFMRKYLINNLKELSKQLTKKVEKKLNDEPKQSKTKFFPYLSTQKNNIKKYQRNI